MVIETEINGTRSADPNNLPELKIRLNFDKDNIEQSVELPRLEFGVGKRNVDDSYRILNQYFIDGVNGGVGVFEGLPIKFFLKTKGRRDEVFNGFIDLTTANFACEKIDADVFSSGGADLIKDTADSFTYEFLREKTNIFPPSLEIAVPYCINSIPDTLNVVVSLFIAYALLKDITDQLTQLIEYITGLPNPFEATSIARITIRVIYIAALVLIFVKTIKQIFQFLIQPIKYHKAINVLVSLQKGAEYLGYKFSSSILEGDYKDMYLIPEKYSMLEADGIKGLLGSTTPKIAQKGYFNGTFKSLLVYIKQVFNARVFVKNGTIFLEKRNYKPNISTYKIPSVELPSYKTNASEFISNYLVSFSTDLTDKNTIQRYKGTACQATTTPIAVINKSNVLTRNFTEIRIPFALAKRKDKLTIPEEVIDAVLTAINTVLTIIVKIVNIIIKVINKIIDFINDILDKVRTIGININLNLRTITPLQLPKLDKLIDSRLGVLEVEQDFISTPKLVILDVAPNPRQTKISLRNDTLLSAKYIYENYHYTEQFTPIRDNTNGNQYKVYENIRVPFTCKDYYSVLESSYIDDGELVSVDWSPLKQEANISFKIPYIYTKNLKTEITEADGR